MLWSWPWKLENCMKAKINQLKIHSEEAVQVDDPSVKCKIRFPSEKWVGRSFQQSRYLLPSVSRKTQSHHWLPPWIASNSWSSPFSITSISWAETTEAQKPLKGATFALVFWEMRGEVLTQSPSHVCNEYLDIYLLRFPSISQSSHKKNPSCQPPQTPKPWHLLRGSISVSKKL